VPEHIYLDRPDWYDRALCRGLTRLFYSELVPDQIAAVYVCEVCPFREQCLDHARSLSVFDLQGILGGLHFSQSTTRRSLTGRDPRQQHRGYHRAFGYRTADEWRLFAIEREHVLATTPDGEGRQHRQRGLRPEVRQEPPSGSEEPSGASGSSGRPTAEGQRADWGH
jgi:hypothetical protein